MYRNVKLNKRVAKAESEKLGKLVPTLDKSGSNIRCDCLIEPNLETSTELKDVPPIPAILIFLTKKMEKTVEIIIKNYLSRSIEIQFGLTARRNYDH